MNSRLELTQGSIQIDKKHDAGESNHEHIDKTRFGRCDGDVRARGNCQRELEAKVTLRGSEVHVKLAAGDSNATLSVSGPNGFYVRAFSESGSPSIDLIRSGGTADGLYRYEVTAASSETKTTVKPMDNGRGGADDATEKVAVSTSGSFYANGGIIADQAKMIEKN